MQNVLVTGGAGFIGSHLVPHLLALGHQVTVLDDLSNGREENIPSEAEFIKMDICNEKITGVMQKKKFDSIIHLAGQTAVSESLKDPIMDEKLNIEGMINILRSACQTGVARIIFSSTAAAYGNNENLPLRESALATPLSFYGLSKVTAEKYIRLYHDYFGIDYIIFRFANVYGERQGDGGEGGVISIFAKQIANDQDIAVFGDGGQTRDFIYAGDISSGLGQALVTDNTNDTYNLSTYTQTSLKQLITLFGNIAHKNFSIKYTKARSGDIYHSMLDNTKAIEKLDWHMHTSLSEGLNKTFAYFKKVKAEAHQCGDIK
ncbi:NAD-dependent epimerase/dehydratase family protein [Pectinatus haikarae]|uniref:NAD-dependent epimerase/dehydratase family protein n=1 Tax=Pectinatus haikarae TaxID=349096 RepID=UPI0018C4EED9|nr:NAD-dependent epimerase/dehydratase family protein [Pectinatus haikarae]